MTTLSLVFGCSTYKTAYLVTICYADYELTNDNSELLMVLVPTASGENYDIISVDGAVLPDANGVTDGGESVQITAGDVLVMEFKGGIYIRQETTPRYFIDGPEQTTVKLRGVGVAKSDGGYNLTLPTTLFANAENLSEGKTVLFYSGTSVEENEKNSVYSAIINEISESGVTVFVSDAKMTTVMNALAYGKFVVKS